MSPRLLTCLCALSALGAYQVAAHFGRSVIAPSAQSAAGASAPEAFPEKAPNGGAASAERMSSLAPEGSAGQQLHFGSIKELSAALRAGAQSSASARLAVMEAINKLGAAELADHLKLEMGSLDFMRTFQFDFQFAARRLGELDPQKAAQLWASTQGSVFGKDALIQPFAEKDPQGFVAWARGLSAEDQKAALRSLSQVAGKAPEQFASILSQFGKGQEGAILARAILENMRNTATKSGSDPAPALAYALAIPEGPSRNAALLELAKWPGGALATNPEVISALAQASPSEVRKLGQELAKVSDKLPQGAAREVAMEFQTREQAKKDPAEAAKRLDALQGTADYPAAVRGFVDATASKDPAAALDWAMTIQNSPFQRAAALEKAVAEYARQKPDAARSWVEKAPLTPAEYFQLTGRVR